jgi:hypothetical protein
MGVQQCILHYRSLQRRISQLVNELHEVDAAASFPQSLVLKLHAEEPSNHLNFVTMKTDQRSQDPALWFREGFAQLHVLRIFSDRELSMVLQDRDI